MHRNGPFQRRTGNGSEGKGRAACKRVCCSTGQVGSNGKAKDTYGYGYGMFLNTVFLSTEPREGNR